MSHQPRFAFAEADDQQTSGAPTDVLTLDLDGYEGPLHVLLELARRQRIDLREISISALADQYLAFVHDIRRTRLEPAADHLVMAAWLTELKSRLLLPKADAAPDGSDELEAAALACRLLRLAAIRAAADALARRAQWNRDVFGRRDPDGLADPEARTTAGDLHQLVRAYTRRRRRPARTEYTAARRVEALALGAARAHLEACMADFAEWTDLQTAAPCWPPDDGPSPTSCLASTLAAGLELVKEGRLRLRQDAPSSPVQLRAPAPGVGPSA